VKLRSESFDVIASSPMRRAWQSAWLLGQGRPVKLVSGFREIHFGRWEGLTREEIQSADPALFEDWMNRAPSFEYPGGEPRSEFKARVEQGLGELAASPGNSALVVAHKGVIRTIVELLTGQMPPTGEPALGEMIDVTAEPEGIWILGRRSSDPPGLAQMA
jgi:broad specificity phosphatase PhoE